MVNKCKVPKCKGHYVSRLNKRTNQLFIGCSEWVKTRCSGKPKGLEWQRVVGVAIFAHPEFPNNYWSLSKAIPTSKPTTIRSFAGLIRTSDMQNLTSTLEDLDDARFDYDEDWDGLDPFI